MSVTEWPQNVLSLNQKLKPLLSALRNKPLRRRGPEHGLLAEKTKKVFAVAPTRQYDESRHSGVEIYRLRRDTCKTINPRP
jgi:hypothetical protein